MQLICRNDTSDFDAWKSDFDGDAEGRRNAGLSVLQIWRAADTPSRVFVLYDVNDRDRAASYLDQLQAKAGGSGSNVTGSDCHFVKTL